MQTVFPDGGLAHNKNGGTLIAAREAVAAHPAAIILVRWALRQSCILSASPDIGSHSLRPSGFDAALGELNVAILTTFTLDFGSTLTSKAMWDPMGCPPFFGGAGEGEITGFCGALGTNEDEGQGRVIQRRQSTSRCKFREGWMVVNTQLRKFYPNAYFSPTTLPLFI